MKKFNLVSLMALLLILVTLSSLGILDFGQLFQADSDGKAIMAEGRYSAPEDVALYIHTFGKIPANFITKEEAEKLGWKSEEGNLWEVTDQLSIGGDIFHNREGLLPDAEGRTWYECDVNYNGSYRGPERIVFSDDGLIYYTNDHYATFTKLYGGKR